MKIDKKKQEEILRKAILKAGGYRKLSKKINIPRSTLTGYINGQLIPEDRFKSLLKFIKVKQEDDFLFERLPDNWKQIKGGINCVISKKKKGTFERDMKNIQSIQSVNLKKWHKFMKQNSPQEYYLTQYSRFKKIGGYKFLTSRGEKVRNLLEKEVADYLFKKKINYEYEPLINVGSHYFFPDFLINKKIIIECTMWRGVEKAYKLRYKIDILKKNYTIYIVIPKTLYSYYESLDNHLILGLDGLVPVAQTFLSPKKQKKEQQVEHTAVRNS